MTATSTLWAAGTPGTSGSTWANAAYAAGANNSTFATFTNAASGGSGYMTCTGYGAQTAIGGPPASVDDVKVTIYHYVNNATRWTSLQAQLYDGSTPLGAAITLTKQTVTTFSETITFSPAQGTTVTWANLANLTVRLTAIHSGTTSGVWYIDAVGVVVDYTARDPNLFAVDYYTAAWTGAATSKSTTIWWKDGDLVVVIAANDNGGTAQFNTPTCTGLSFPAGGDGQIGADSSHSCMNSWKATAVGDGSGTLTVSATASSVFGFGVWVWHKCGGAGNRIATVVSTAPHTMMTAQLTRAGDNSYVCGAWGDWSAGAVTSYAWAPAGANSRTAPYADGTNYSYGAADWPSQGAAGSASYGISGGSTPTGPVSKLYIEVKAAAAPSGLLPGQLARRWVRPPRPVTRAVFS